MLDIKDLLKMFSGFKNFREKMFSEYHDEYLKELSESQNPKILVIACSDSRVDPAILANANLGDLFVIRNVANIVPPYEEDETTHHGTSAAIEYAVNFLSVKHIVILGHSHCGGIQTLLEANQSNTKYYFIKHWVSIVKEAKEISKNYKKEDQATICEQQSIIISLNNLKTFPFIKDKIEQNSLMIHGLYFKINSGDLMYYRQNENKFVDIKEVLQ